MSNKKQKVNIKYFSVVYQRWIESEAGWGQRPDGVSLHLTTDDHKMFIKKYWDDEKKRNPSGNTPSIYSREDGSPGLISVPEDYYNVLVDKRSDGEYGTFISDIHFNLLQSAKH